MHLLVIGLGLISCEKFVTIQPTTSRLVTPSVFINNDAVTSAQTSIYSQMIKASYDISKSDGLLSDELISYATFGSDLEFYVNSILPTDQLGYWSFAYKYIYQENAILEGLSNSTSINIAIKRQIQGEAKFIRAFWHFYLVNTYGDVPIITSTDYTINAHLARMPVGLVYKQILADLHDAQNLLSEKFVDGSDTTVTLDRGRPTKWAATALLARTFLYMKQYDSAAIAASQVIEHASLFSIVDDLNSVFLMNSKEAIWQLAIPQPSSSNTPDGSNYILMARPANVSISEHLISSFEINDLRLKSWIDTIVTSSPSDTFYYPYKYKVRIGGDLSEYVMVLRLAEQYLIRAEAKANGADGGLPEAITDMNVLRKRAGLLDYSGDISQNAVLSAILHERQVELFTEWGHRWFDLVRTNSADTVMGVPGNVTQQKGGIWNADGHQKLYPIWQSEININSNLKQNNGY